MQAPETRYAKSGDVHIAYQVMGAGPDVVIVPNFVSNLEFVSPVGGPAASPREHLASFCRVIAFDRRGTGLSDRVDPGTLEARMDDIRAVMDAAGSERATLYGGGDGGTLCLLFAATYPERTTSLILVGSYARRLWAPDYPWGTPEDVAKREAEEMADTWGTGEVIVSRFASDATGAERDDLLKNMARYERACASPGAVATLRARTYEVDVRDVLPTIRVPTLVMHAEDDHLVPAAHSRYIVDHIEGAKYVALEGGRRLGLSGARQETVLSAVQEFVTGVRRKPDADRVLATVLFTDIVGSTERAVALGDKEWRTILESHDALSSREIDNHRGRRVKTMGDGLLATFDGPGRAVFCACAIRNRVRDIGVDIRAGLHIGEIELLGDDVGGIAVHIGQRVSALASPGEVLVSSTIVDLVAGSGLDFEDRGEHELKGVPRPWRIYAATQSE